ncbi:MAG: transposase [Kouleothrix sp.]|nr:transposase [Kouleothrix sp.]
MQTIRELAAQGKSIRTIVAETGIARNTVRKYLRGTPVAAPRPRRTSKPDPFKDQIRRWISEDHLLNCQTMLERLEAQGYTGSISILKDFVQPLRPARPGRQPVRRYETKPGEQMQVDWGEFVFEQDGQIRKLYGFTAVLSYSRMRFVCFSKRCDTSSLIRGLLRPVSTLRTADCHSDRPDEERARADGRQDPAMEQPVCRLPERYRGDGAGLSGLHPTDQRQDRAQHRRGQAELLARRAVYRSGRPQPASAAVV